MAQSTTITPEDFARGVQHGREAQRDAATQKRDEKTTETKGTSQAESQALQADASHISSSPTSKTDRPQIVPGPSPVSAPQTASAVSAAAPIVDTAVNPMRSPPFQVHSNVNIPRYLKALIYGEYGSGKSLLCGTSVALPQMRDVLMTSVEQGELTLAPDLNDPTPYHLIDIVHVKDYATTARVYDFLKAHCSARDKAVRGDKEAIDHLRRLQDWLLPEVPDPERLRFYRTSITDSLSEVEALCMYSLLGVTVDTAADEESSSPEWAEYNRQRNMIHRLIRNFRNLPMNVIFTCSRRFREIKEGGTTRRLYAPQMTGQLAGDVQGFMDLVGFLVVGDPPPATEDNPDPPAPRRMFIQPGPRHAAKNRFRSYKRSFFDNPTMPTIIEAVGLLQKEKQYGN
jgi:hypothetical protein